MLLVVVVRRTVGGAPKAALPVASSAGSSGEGRKGTATAATPPLMLLLVVVRKSEEGAPKAALPIASTAGSSGEDGKGAATAATADAAGWWW